MNNKPWEHEPDLVEWIDAATGFECMIKRSSLTGALCGYVGVPITHPTYGVNYSFGRRSSIDWPIYGLGEAILNVHVHGGLTYAQRGKNDLWWFGFDCSHSTDYFGKYSIGSGNQKDYRNINYVRRNCTKLAQQLKAIEELAYDAPDYPCDSTAQL